MVGSQDCNSVLAWRKSRSVVLTEITGYEKKEKVLQTPRTFSFFYRTKLKLFPLDKKNSNLKSQLSWTLLHLRVPHPRLMIFQMMESRL